MAAALPIVGILASTVLSAALAPKPPAIPAPPAPVAPPAPPPLPEENNVDPEGVLDQEAARRRAISRNQQAEERALLDEEETPTVNKKTLLGE